MIGCCQPTVSHKAIETVANKFKPYQKEDSKLNLISSAAQKSSLEVKPNTIARKFLIKRKRVTSDIEEPKLQTSGSFMTSMTRGIGAHSTRNTTGLVNELSSMALKAAATVYREPLMSRAKVARNSSLDGRQTLGSFGKSKEAKQSRVIKSRV